MSSKSKGGPKVQLPRRPLNQIACRFHGRLAPRQVCGPCADLLVQEHKDMAKQMKEYPGVVRGLIESNENFQKTVKRLTDGLQGVLDATHAEYCEGTGPMKLPKYQGTSGNYHHPACQFVQDVLYGRERVPTEGLNEPPPLRSIEGGMDMKPTTLPPGVKGTGV